jgi:hypothetical protein
MFDVFAGFAGRCWVIFWHSFQVLDLPLRVRTLVIVVMAPVFEEEKILPIVEEFATFRMESSVRHSQLWLQLADPAITVFTFKSVS